MIDATQFWAPWEITADSFEQVQESVYGVFEKWSERGAVFAWRGQVDASWSLHSSLYRRMLWSSAQAGPPTEASVAETERQILANVHRWGLHMGEYGRLSVLNQLAMLQHYGAPTRLIDITFNPWIGLWFAVQQRQADSANAQPDVRLFAFDVTSRLINERGPDLRGWEDDLHIPWPRPVSSADDEWQAYRDWITSAYAWSPARFHPRLAAQNGGFLLGGVPSTGVIVWPKTTSPDSERWTIDDVRRATSVAMRVHKIAPAAGGPQADAMYTIRIRAAAVPAIRERLQERFGYQPATIYPDFPGFADFGTPTLRRTPPPGGVLAL